MIHFPIPERPDHLNLLLAEFRRLPKAVYEAANKVTITLPDGTEAVVKDRFGHRTHNPLDFLGEAGRKWYRPE